jgi:hypothetical protein
VIAVDEDSQVSGADRSCRPAKLGVVLKAHRVGQAIAAFNLMLTRSISGVAVTDKEGACSLRFVCSRLRALRSFTVLVQAA